MSGRARDGSERQLSRACARRAACCTPWSTRRARSGAAVRAGWRPGCSAVSWGRRSATLRGSRGTIRSIRRRGATCKRARESWRERRRSRSRPSPSATPSRSRPLWARPGCSFMRAGSCSSPGSRRPRPSCAGCSTRPPRATRGCACSASSRSLRGLERRARRSARQPPRPAPPGRRAPRALPAPLRAEALADDPGLDLLYADHNRLSASGARHSPFFKPRFHPELLWSVDLFGPLALLRADLARALQLRAAFAPAERFDLLLRPRAARASPPSPSSSRTSATRPSLAQARHPRASSPRRPSGAPSKPSCSASSPARASCRAPPRRPGASSSRRPRSARWSARSSAPATAPGSCAARSRASSRAPTGLRSS